MLAQRTIKTLTQAVGVGLHSGQRVELTLRPAPPGTGIVFRRVDLADPVDIPVSAQSVTDTRLASTISSGQAKVHTVEHLMSACAGLGIDNLIIDITAEEVPILDGSASSFVFLLQSAGIELQKVARQFIRVLKTVEVKDGQGENLKWAKLEPYEGYRLSFEIDFQHPAVDSTGQHVVFDMGRDVYARDIARAERLSAMRARLVQARLERNFLAAQTFKRHHQCNVGMLDEIARILQRKDCKRERNRRAVDEARGVLGGQIKRRRQARNA